MKRQHIPLRRCAGCWTMKPKTELLRIVRLPSENTLVPDPTGKRPGRGAYLCRDTACFARAEKKRGFERSFRQNVPSEWYRTIQQAMQPVLST